MLVILNLLYHPMATHLLESGDMVHRVIGRAIGMGRGYGKYLRMIHQVHYPDFDSDALKR
jgi:hypothetical protein